MTLSVTHSTVTGATADSTALVDGVAWDAAHTLTGTASAAQLNENVVQIVVDDTNVTGDIASQTLTLGWTGTLALSRLATGTSGYALIGNGVSAPSYQGFLQSGADAVTRTWQSKAAETVSVLDFIPVALHAGIKAGTDATDLQTYLAAARTYAGTLSQPCEIVFPAGKYTTSVSPNWALNNLCLRTEGEVVWNYTGTGNCFIVDCGAYPASGVANMYIGRFTIQGTSSALNGAYFRGVHHSYIEGPNIRGCGTSYSGILSEFCVVTQWNKPTVSNNEGSFGSAAPANGMKLDVRDSSEKTSYCTITNPIFEGLAVGCYLAGSTGNIFLGGTMEGCTSQGLLLGATAVRNMVFGTDFEVNTQDIYCAGADNTFYDSDTSTIIILDGTSNGNIVTDGVHKQITIQSGGTNNCIKSARYNWDNSGATISDAGTTTRLFMNYDIGNGTWAGVTAENIATNAVTYPKIQQVAQDRILGRITTGAGTVEELTGSNVRTITGLATSDTPTFAGIAYTSTITGTTTNASALAVGRQGATDPVLKVNASTASVATGIEITGAAAAGGVNVAAISSGTNENLTLNAKGSGTITLGNTSTGAITLTRATTMSAALTYGGVTLSNAVTGTGNMVLSASPTLTGTLTAAAISASGTVLGSGGIFTADGASFGWGASTASIVGNSSANVFVFYTASTERFRISDLFISSTLPVVSTHATGGIGYATGAGGAVTQGTSRTTGVTLNKVTGAITLFSAAGSTTYQSFTVTNSAVAATDTILVNQKSGTDLYEIHVTAVAAGSFSITYRTTGGTTTEQPVFNFAVIKAVSA